MLVHQRAQLGRQFVHDRDAQNGLMIRIQPVNLHGPSRPVAPPAIRQVVHERRVQGMRESATARAAFTEEMNVERRFQRRMIRILEGDEVLGNG